MGGAALIMLHAVGQILKRIRPCAIQHVYHDSTWLLQHLILSIAFFGMQDEGQVYVFVSRGRSAFGILWRMLATAICMCISIGRCAASHLLLVLCQARES